MLFDTIAIIAAVIIIGRNLFAKHGRIGISLLAIGLSALLTASLTPYYLSFLKIPNQGAATIAYYIITYLLFYVLLAVPSILLSSLIQLVVAFLLLGFIVHLLPPTVSGALISRSRIYPVMAPLFGHIPQINPGALLQWLRQLFKTRSTSTTGILSVTVPR